MMDLGLAVCRSKVKVAGLNSRELDIVTNHRRPIISSSPFPSHFSFAHGHYLNSGKFSAPGSGRI